MVFAECAYAVQSAHERHRDINDCDVRLVLSQRSLERASIADNINDLVTFPEHARDSLGKQIVIVSQKHSSRHVSSYSNTYTHH